MAHNKRHHFVPRTYLKSWAIDGTLISIAKDGTGLTREQPPKSIAKKNKLYTLPSTFFNKSDSTNPYYNSLITEKLLLKHFEDEWVTVRTRMNSHLDLTPVLRSLKNFVIVQSLRTPKFLRQNKEKLRRLGRTENEIDDAFHFAVTILRCLPVYAENCICEIVKNIDVTNFITSDNPSTPWLKRGDTFQPLNGMALRDDLHGNPNYKILSPIHPKYFAILTPNIGLKVSEADKKTIWIKSTDENTVKG